MLECGCGLKVKRNLRLGVKRPIDFSSGPGAYVLWVSKIRHINTHT